MRDISPLAPESRHAGLSETLSQTFCVSLFLAAEVVRADMKKGVVMPESERGTRPGAGWRHAGAVLLAAYLASSVWSFAVSDEQHLLGRFSDDAFYYFTIATNHAKTGTLTFDGETVTNGFHPLWLALLLPFFRATSDRVLALRLAGITSSLLTVGAAYIAWRFLVRWHSWTAAVLGFLIVLFYVKALDHSCMETSLALPLLMIALSLLERSNPWGSPRPPTGLLLLGGITLSLAQLARLDVVFLNLSLVATVLYMSWLRYGFRSAAFRTLLLGGPVVATGASYLTWNLVRFGHMIPVSGTAKSLGASAFNVKFAQQLLYLPAAPDRSVLWLVYTAIVVVCLVWLGRAAWRRATSARARAGLTQSDSQLGIRATVAAFISSFTAWYLLRSSWHAWPWYSYPALPAAAVVVPAALEEALGRMGRGLRRFAGAGATIMLVVALAVLIRSGLWAQREASESYMYQNYELALVLNRELGPNARLAMGGCAGSLGYFFDGRVLQLEGLVGGYEILDAICENRLADYMTRFGVTHVVAFEDLPKEYDEWTLVVPSAYHTTGPRADIPVRKADEIFRDDGGRRSLVVWEWPETQRPR